MPDKKFQEKHIDTEYGKIYYYRLKSLANGQAKKPAVLFLHGLSANHTTWEKGARAVYQAGYKPLIPDLRGHGHSAKRKRKSLYHFKQFSQDILEILQKEKVKKTILVGYSFGGSLAIDFSLRHPDKVAGLILISANHDNPLKYLKLRILVPFAKAFLLLLSFFVIWHAKKNYYYYQPIKEKGYLKSVWLGFKTMPLSVNFWMLLMMDELNYRNKLGMIKAPVWIVHSPNDPFVTEAEVKDMMSSLPRTKEIIIDCKSHFLATGAQEEVNRIVLEYLSKNHL